MKGQKLLHQCVVMAWTRIESQKLRYFRLNQTKMRAETYDKLQNDVTFESRNGRDHGKRVILPYTHTGSPRWYKRKNHEALAIARAKGKPHLFITMTCNSYHLHILAALDESMEPSDRPDIIAQIFKQHIEEWVGMLFNSVIPGWEKSIGQIYVIEFQKRGLLHVHILVILKRDHAIQEDEIEKYAIAQISDRNNVENNEIWEHVITKMVHIPCGDFNTNTGCINNQRGKCSSRFPKEYPEENYFDESGSAIYKRLSPESGRNSAWISTANSDGVYIDYEVTDKDVVSYNPFLLKDFKCYINVDVCSSIKVIKHLLWYTCKVSILFYY